MSEYHDQAGVTVLRYDGEGWPVAGSRVNAAIAALDRFGGPMNRERAERLLPDWWRARLLTADEKAKVLARFPVDIEER